jgi:membrane-bound lytic murein transglycosylase F
MTLKNRQFYLGLAARVSILTLFIFLSNCEGPRYYSQAELSQLQDLDKIEVLILNQPLSYSKKNLSLGRGLDYDLLNEFAKHFNKKISFIPFNNESDLVEAFKSGRGQLAAGRFPKSFVESNGFTPGPDYEAAALSLFCHKKFNITKIDDLRNKKIITFNKYNDVVSYQKLKTEIPHAQIEVWMNGSGLRAFNEIQNQKSDCLILNHTEGMFFQKQFLNAEYKFKLQDYFSLNWMIQKDHTYLSSLLKSWIQEASRTGVLLKNFDRYRILSEELSDVDIYLFLKRTDSRLPEYISYFKKAGLKYKLPWELVAAIAYQESQWDPKAKSFTGVQGLMQITKSTAQDLGIEDIHDAEENIFGGARYFKQLINLMPGHLNHSDKIVLALAAYNIGIGHLNDAFKIAQEHGKNPYHWNHLRKILPKLTDEKYYSKTQFGIARGYETVEYVERTKAYYHFLISRGG